MKKWGNPRYPDLADLCGKTCSSGQGYDEAFVQNTCITVTSHVHSYAGCESTRAYDPLSTSPLNANNTYLLRQGFLLILCLDFLVSFTALLWSRYMTADGNATLACGRSSWSLEEAQAAGYDQGSTVRPAPSASEIAAMAQQLLDRGLTGSPPAVAGERPGRLKLDDGAIKRRAFPVGFDTGPASTAAQFTAAATTVSDEARRGMNMVMLYHSVQTGHSAAEMAEIGTFLDRCADLGVAVAYDLSKLVQASTRRSNPVPRMKEALEQEVRAVMAHPAIVNGGLFYLSDEPDGQDLDPVAFHGAYRLVKATAPGVPVAICLCDVPPNWASHLWPHYANSTDISESQIILLELTTIA